MTPHAAGAVLQVAALVFGGIVGSFLNVVIIRLPEGRSVVLPGSACSACGRPVRWYDNVPVLAWLWLRGRCRDCGARLSLQYPLVEAGTALLSLLALRTFGPALEYVIAFAFLAALVAAGGVDLKIREIPDAITLPGIVIALGVSPWSGLLAGPLDGLVGALVGAGGLYLVAEIHGWLRGFEDFEGMGRGDLKLMGLIGAVLGWQAVVPTILLASVAGAAAGLAVMAARRTFDLQVGVPFGPFLAAAAAATLFFPEWPAALLARVAG